MHASLVPFCVVAICLLPAAAMADDVNVIVGFHAKTEGSSFTKHGGRVDTDLSAIKALAGRVPAAKLKALRSEPGVAYVEEDGIAHAIYEPNDTYFGNANSSSSYQYEDFYFFNAPYAWDVTWGEGVIVSVLDTGYQDTHPDLAGKAVIVRNWTSSSTTNVSDVHGHGTHTAGTVGAWTDNGYAVAGTAPACSLAIGKVLGNSGSGTYSWIAAGINWSWQTAGARVVSMSLGGTSPSTTLLNAVNNAWNNGLVVVSAAGNNGNSTPFYPAYYANSMAVAAINTRKNDGIADGSRASFSNYGASWVDIAAPGVYIRSTYKNTSTALLSGTSMATPHVAGVAALVFSRNPGLANGDVRYLLEATAFPTGYNYPDGAAITCVDAFWAVYWALPF